jgi:hypothetical protein
MIFNVLVAAALVDGAHAFLANSYDCSTGVTPGEQSSSYGFFYLNTEPDAPIWVTPGMTAPGAGTFCPLGDFNEVSVGTYKAAVSESNPLIVGYGLLNAGGTGGFFLTETVGMAGICNLTTYDTDASQRLDIEPDIPIRFGARISSEQTQTNSTCNYASTEASIYMGDNVMGGVVGISSYVNTGTGNCTTQVSGFQTPVRNGCGSVVVGSVESGLSMGARGTLTQICNSLEGICIGETASGTPATGTCSDRVFGSFASKYSIFMLAQGTNFDWNTTSCGNGSTVPAHVGIRQTYAIGPLGFSTTMTVSTAVTFNNGIAASAIGNTDITQMSINDFNVVFPTQYNYGIKIDSTTFNTTGTGTVKIRYQALNSESFNLDYIFPTEHIPTADSYIVYDPTIESTGGGGSSAVVAQASAIVVAVTMISALWSAF